MSLTKNKIFADNHSGSLYERLGVKNSETQINTPSDGCVYVGLSDQTGVHHTELRKLAVSKIKDVIDLNILS